MKKEMDEIYTKAAISSYAVIMLTKAGLSTMIDVKCSVLEYAQ